MSRRPRNIWHWPSLQWNGFFRRRLEPSVFGVVSRRPTNSGLPGTDCDTPQPGETVQSPGSVSLGGCLTQLPKGTRSFEFQKGRDVQTSKEGGNFCISPIQSRCTITKEAAEVPEEAEGFCSPGVLSEAKEKVKGGDANGGASSGEGTCPCDRCYPEPVRGSTVGDPPISRRVACKGDDIENHEEGRSVLPGISKEKKAPTAQSCLGNLPEAKCMFDGFETELSHSKWCSWLLMMVFRTRTPFAVFLRSTLNLPRSSTSASALFPIPCPPGVMFGRMPPGTAAKSRRRIHYGRVLHVLVAALNYWHFGGFCGDLSSMGRAPTSAHLRIYSRLRSFIRSDSGMPPVKIAKAGRRFPQLVARLGEISESVTKLGLSQDPYSRSFQGVPVHEQNDKIPELQPYRDLDADRIALFGKGHWDITAHLSDALVMAYREPSSILIDRIPEPWEYPTCRDPPEMLLKLAKLWDQNNLLVLHTDPSSDLRPFEKVRIFNNYKSREVDRQIGDRRGRNSIEYKVESISEGLPSGTHLCDILVDPRIETIRISVSDRKDYYHQIACTTNRASTNTIGTVSKVDAEQFGAFGVFLQQKALSGYSRNKHGDLLRGNSRPLRKVPDVLHMSFGAILQGDHAGVEFATCAHSSILEEGGAIEESSHLLATKTLRSADRIQGLVIDDFFSLSVEAQHASADHSDSAIRHKKALDIYEKFGLLGSPQKDLQQLRREKLLVLRLTLLKQLEGADLSRYLHRLKRGTLYHGWRFWLPSWVSLRMLCI